MGMFSNRLQQTLNSRIQFIQNLLLIYSYSELVNLRIDSYRRQNNKSYEKQCLLLQTYRNIFKMDQKFRKLFYNLICKVFTRLNNQFKPLNNKNTTNKMQASYLQFMAFFKKINELQIVRYLQKVQLQSSQNTLFFILTDTLIRYMKIKTDAIIIKLNDKCKKEDLNFYEDKTIQIIQSDKGSSHRKRITERKRILDFSRKKVSSPVLQSKRFHSQELKRQGLSTRRSYSKQKWQKGIGNLITVRNIAIKDSSAINWRVGIKRFKEVYSQEWQQYYSFLLPAISQLQELKGKSSRIHILNKKQWINEHFSSLYHESLSRNQRISKLRMRQGKSILPTKSTLPTFNHKCIQKIIR